MLTLPAESFIAEHCEAFDPRRIHVARETLRWQLAVRLYDDWVWAWRVCQTDEPYRPDPEQSGRRSLSNLALRHLLLAEQSDGTNLWSQEAFERVECGAHMTDRFGALEALVEARAPLAAAGLERFHARFADNPLLLDKWFALQARAPEPLAGPPGAALREVESLMQHRSFTLTNPNRARSVITTYCQNNPGAFHLKDGSGYSFWVRQVRELDRINPSVASRVARSLYRWRGLAPPWRERAQLALIELAATRGLSAEVTEVLDRALVSIST